MEEPTKVSLTEFRADISKYLALASAGRVVIVTDYGKARAMLVPPPEEKDEDDAKE